MYIDTQLYNLYANLTFSLKIKNCFYKIKLKSFYLNETTDYANRIIIIFTNKSGRGDFWKPKETLNKNFEKHWYKR